MPIRRSQKRSNAEPRQKQNHRSVVIDPMVNPGSSAHRHQARSRADPTRTHHRMVTVAQSSPGDRSACAPQSKTTTVMLGIGLGLLGAGAFYGAYGYPAYYGYDDGYGGYRGCGYGGYRG